MSPVGRVIGSLITVHKVQPGEARAGCGPRDIQVFYKESTAAEGSPDFFYLGDLLKGRGLSVLAGGCPNHLEGILPDKGNHRTATDTVVLAAPLTKPGKG